MSSKINIKCIPRHCRWFIKVHNSEVYDDWFKYWIIRKSDNINDSGILLTHKAVDVVIK